MSAASAKRSKNSSPCAHATSSRPRYRPSRSGKQLSPLQQGALDGLCSIYAIINALRLLHPHTITPTFTRALLETLFETLSDRLGPSESLCRGAELDDLHALLRKAQRTLRIETDFRIEVSKVRLPRERRRLDVLWSLLRGRIGDGAVAIIGLAGFHAHWTVGYRMTAKSIRLFDSDGLHRLARKHCSLREKRCRHLLVPDDILYR